MRTFPIARPDGTMHAFEVRNLLLFGHTIESVLLAVPTVSAVHRVRDGDIRFRFQLGGVPCIIDEPWGDNSRYWVGPDDATRQDVDLSPVAKAFDQHKGMIDKIIERLTRLKGG